MPGGAASAATGPARMASAAKLNSEAKNIRIHSVPMLSLGNAFDGSSSDSTSGAAAALSSPPAYKPPRKNWRLKRGATPQWYKHRHGVRTRAQSGAARVARFRPPGLKVSR